MLNSSKTVKSRHITLLRPPLISAAKSFSSPVTAPLTLAYLTAALKKVNCTVTPIDAIGEAIDQIILYKNPTYRVRGLTTQEIIDRIPFDTYILGVSCMFSQEWIYIKSLIENIKAALPHLIIVIGGEHATALTEDILNTCSAVDICTLGEGEETIVEIAQLYPYKKDQIAGIAYRLEEGGIVYTPRRVRIQHLDNIARPSWEELPLEEYLSRGLGQGINTGRSIPMLATRGCPYQCTFCSNKEMWTQKYYTRSPADVIDEIQYYIKHYQIDNVEFFDLTAIVNKEWVIQFGKLMKEKKLSITWSLPSGTRSECLDKEVIQLLAETHCKYLVYAVESGSSRVLKSIKKQIHLKTVLASMRQAKKNGINLRCNLMMGFPNERRSDVFKTIFFQIRLALMGVDDAPIFMFAPYPGTELFRYLQKKGVIPQTDEKYYRSLLCQMDLTQSSSYCEHIGAYELNFYRVLGMSLFYLLSYLCFPQRIIRSIRNTLRRTQTDSVFEQRIVEFLLTRQQIALSSAKLQNLETN